MNTPFETLICAYFNHVEYNITDVPFGQTNTTKILEIDGHQYIMRIYNKYTKSIEGIELESEITTTLDNNVDMFEVPIFLRTLNNAKYIELEEGSLGAVTTFLQGAVPQIMSAEQAREFGRLVGGFSARVREFSVDNHIYRGTSFTKMYDIHPLATSQSIRSFLENPPFPISRKLLAFYRDMIEAVEGSGQTLEVLPHQFVHHDLLIYNLLAQNNKVTGVLDFDFISWDVAFMECTISLNHLIHESEGSFEMIESFLTGYSSERKHSSQEIEHLMLLTQIYYISVLHFYIGQHYAGITVEHNFIFILQQLERNIQWLHQNEYQLQTLLYEHLVH
ncbi:Ser/Thr protein kinase RdoA (MazF antagonist) [Paenibacillus amylolyticus]|uniref:Ser/Thr protein kinase RdoA (MazF antagonist) n=1 Tax=Paenibacillus amylolyticus TaxID=1451 RepID=A0AAP5LRJ3_PAEAM|nr:phosphotransferase [Paenibacillus amylolyticus]MDR6726740.1 Ser/Thr protein kinase RdoA (MazF antagonist) [Paenibacillus amylolyticus]